MHRRRIRVAAAVLALAALVGATFLLSSSPRQGGRIATLLPGRVAPTVVGWPVHMQDATRGPGQDAARFSDPYGIAVAADGTVYVADAGDHNRILRIAPDGGVAVFAGGAEAYADGAGAAAAFNTPSGLALDRAGNLYVADTGNNAVRKITPQGQVSTLAGGGEAGFADGVGRAARFNGPVGVAVDRRGDVIVADTYNDRIRRITPAGVVSTVAGGAPGLRGGASAQAQFDTPTSVAVDALGNLYVADTGNALVRRIGVDGQVGLVGATGSPDGMRTPLALALTHDGFLYVGDMARGRIWQIGPDGVLHGLTGVGIDIAVGDAVKPRLARPTGLALAHDGSLFVADSVGRRVLKLSAHAAPPAPATPVAAVVSMPAAPATATPAADFPWPVAPQHGWHEVVGVVGECRGSYSGESRDHFHNGLDVQAPMGTPVLAVAAEKVASPLPNWAYGELGEGMTLDSMGYLHMRVGRDVRDRPLDPARFTVVLNEQGKPARVRVKRGARFAVGDTLGTVNRMFHVHLFERGEQNPIALPFKGMADHIAPHIDSVFLNGPDGKPIAAARGKPVPVAAAGGPLSLVVEAWDQMDGNEARRKLGLYKLGFQVLGADGAPLAGFEEPRFNIEFNRLPPDPESTATAYAEGSGITVYGSARTRFLYVATNIVRDGRAETGGWDPAALAPGDYVIRVHAADYAGNVARFNRDLRIKVY